MILFVLVPKKALVILAQPIEVRRIPFQYRRQQLDRLGEGDPVHFIL
jgi:hypothetical protein